MYQIKKLFNCLTASDTSDVKMNIFSILLPVQYSFNQLTEKKTTLIALETLQFSVKTKNKLLGAAARVLTVEVQELAHTAEGRTRHCGSYYLLYNLTSITGTSSRTQ